MIAAILLAAMCVGAVWICRMEGEFNEHTMQIPSRASRKDNQRV